jgi:hypothetical protein
MSFLFFRAWIHLWDELPLSETQSLGTILTVRNGVISNTVRARVPESLDHYTSTVS